MGCDDNQQDAPERKDDFMYEDFRILFESDVSCKAVTVYLYLNLRRNQENTCWPSMSTIARDLHCGNSTVCKAVKELVKKGFIETEHRKREDGGNSSLLYTLLI